MTLQVVDVRGKDEISVAQLLFGNEQPQLPACSVISSDSL